MKSLKLAFFWHMHQPDYRDASGIMKMPWVFLHAIKDYYEMPWLLSRYEGIKASFNVTAPLIEQLHLYKEPLENDYFLSLWAKPPSALEASEREWVIKLCKSPQYEPMVKPLKRYDELYRQSEYSDAELIEMEILFMLAWCGNFLRQNNPLVKSCLSRERGFEQKDKLPLLQTLQAFVATIIPFYADLQDKGIISVATTPYNHPILPLLLDMNNARYANVHTPLPDAPLSLREDAIKQVSQAIDLYQENFGCLPKGFWPAEGAVDEESIGIYRDMGINWIATDEAILFKSLGSEERSHLYHAYEHQGVSMGFRDHGLSDLIGFNYRFKPADEAVEHFMRSLEHISKEQEDATVFVILDGENAWEFYPDNAYGFFTSLYEAIGGSTWCQSVTMDEVNALPNKPTLDHIAPGSWIHGDFNTWSGHYEKNRAWELIYLSKRETSEALEHADEITKKVVEHHFLAAECSDWFWWYGDDHVTEFGVEFDALFRSHLIAIYQLLSLAPPAVLFKPILTQHEHEPFMSEPRAFVYPHKGSEHVPFFSWVDGGMIDETKLFSTMDRVRGPIEKIFYGHNESFVELAFCGDIPALEGVQLFLSVSECEREWMLDIKSQEFEGLSMHLGQCIELSLSRSLFEGLASIHLRCELRQGDTIVQTLPGFGALKITLDEHFADQWFV